MLASLVKLNRASTVGWVGLGAMGHPMALNLFRKSANLSTPPTTFLVCEPDADRAAAFVREAATAGRAVERVDTPRRIAQRASRIFTMLPSTPHVQSVYLDPATGILPALAELAPPAAGHASAEQALSAQVADTVCVDHTTLDPIVAREVAAKVSSETAGRAVMVDAPVSGGIMAAKDGTLTIMLGSPSRDVTDSVRPYLALMSQDGGVIECGTSGAGVGVKVCNNLILAVNQIALAEGLALGESLGIDPLLLHRVVNASSGQSWSSRVNSPLAGVPDSPGSRAYTGGFQSRLMLKDVNLALAAAHATDLATPLTWAARSVYDAVCAEGWEGKDFSVVYEWVRKMRDKGVERGWKDGRPGDA
ncbi:hypothetical protein Q5752_001375 [Cryptotrichosporon argae]